MTLPYRLPEVAVTETLTPQFIARNFRRVQQDLDDSMARKYVYGSFMLDFSGTVDTNPSDAFRFRLNVPFSFDVVGIEVEAYSTSANISQLLINSTASGWVVQSLTMTANTLVTSTDNFTCTVTGSTDFNLVVGATATPWTLDGCHVTIHYRCSRGNSGDAYSGYAITSLPGIGAPVARDQLNTEFANLAAAVARNTAASKCQRISVYTTRNPNAAVPANPIPTQLASTRVPATLRRIVRVDVGVVAAGASVWTAQIQGLVATATVTVANTLTTASNTSFSVFQTLDTPTNPANDSNVTLGHTSGAFVASLLYSVVYYY